MTDETRTRLRGVLELLVSYTSRLDGEVRFQTDTGRLGAYVTYTDHVGVQAVISSTPGQVGAESPPLTTAQQLALSVLVGEPDRAVLSALCDLLIEQGHEYAAAVAEKARREERERILKGIDKRIATWATEKQRADTRAAREQSLWCTVRISELQVIADLLREPT